MVDKSSEFHNSFFKKWLKDNEIEMYSTHNVGKSVVVERFVRTLKNTIYKHTTAVSKNVYINKLDEIVNEYNDTYNRKIKMKPVDVKVNAYIDSGKEVNKRYTPYWSEEMFEIKKVKSTIPWTYVINDLNGL